ncbi:hypothetical protein GOP47_0012789 [Adiantum capillus-veneris]|uniref:Uncharacterized protein n=1 Tax=Adiantum capillus-veneris TaxID=13818 RepID=A0A9D4ZEM8_ADICA|nr:hypothetical protein GOP47_0012789 [Adiantum capillus-veneris]
MSCFSKIPIEWEEEREEQQATQEEPQQRLAKIMGQEMGLPPLKEQSEDMAQEQEQKEEPPHEDLPPFDPAKIVKE